MYVYRMYVFHESFIFSYRMIYKIFRSLADIGKTHSSAKSKFCLIHNQLKVTGHSKIKKICRVSSISTRLFC